MGKNKTKIKLSLLFTIAFLCLQLKCTVTKNDSILQGKGPNSNDRLANIFIEKLNLNSVSNCDFNLVPKKSNRITSIIHANYNDFLCITRKARQGDKEAIRMITTIASFWEQDKPVEYLSTIMFEKISDPLLFGAFINLLKHDTGSDYSSDFIKGPVYLQVDLKLVKPMIHTINGLPKEDYFQSENYKQSYEVSAQEYYQQMKSLWDEGKIKLKNFD